MIIFMMLKKLLLSKYTSIFNYFLCIVIVLRMIFVIKINISIPYFLKTINHNYGINKLQYIINSITKTFNNKFLEIMYCIWIIGTISLILYYIYCNIRFYRGIINLKEEIYDDNIFNILKEQKKMLNIEKDIKVYMLDGIYSPMLVGLKKPKIIIPNRHYDYKDLKFIFRHELIHYKRKDNFLKVILTLVISIYWFNPIVYILKRYFNDYCELSCDELVVKKYTIDETKEYSLILLDMMKYKNILDSHLCMSQLNINKDNVIKVRIEKMLDFKKRKRGSIIGILLVIIISRSIVSFNTKYDVIKIDEKNQNKLILLETEKLLITNSSVGDMGSTFTIKTKINKHKKPDGI